MMRRDPSRRQLKDVCVKPKDTLRHAMTVIDATGIELAFVVDDDARVVGTLSDGDIRRAILRGIALDVPAVEDAMNRKFTWVDGDVSRAEVVDMMRALSVQQVPVLDIDKRMIGLHLLYELIGSVTRPNTALIMAGGSGVRLRPLTNDIPKPMLRVAGRPILERLVLHLVSAGIREIWISVHYLGHMIEDHFGRGERFGCNIRYVKEETPLGTAGAISLLPEGLVHPLLVMNGDLVTQMDLAPLLDGHPKSACAMTMSLKPYVVDIPYGVVDVQDGKVIGMREKPSNAMLVNAGIYVLSPAAIALVPKNQEFAMTQVASTCLEKGLGVAAHVLEDEWIDVGRPDQLKAARGT